MPRGKRTIRKIIVHHSASPVSTTVADIDRWHKERGWRGIGYHYVVLEHGEIAEGRHVNKRGAHTLHHNTDSIGICVTGNFENYHCPKPRFDALVHFINELIDKYDLDWTKVHYHKEFANTACCGKFLIDQLIQYRRGNIC
jgi:N-acetylmuramoyl-L-alanine amidase